MGENEISLKKKKIKLSLQNLGQRYRNSGRKSTSQACVGISVGWPILPLHAFTLLASKIMTPHRSRYDYRQPNVQQQNYICDRLNTWHFIFNETTSHFIALCYFSPTNGNTFFSPIFIFAFSKWNTIFHERKMFLKIRI